MVSTKKELGVITKFWAILQMAVDGVLGEEIFLALLIFIISFFLHFFFFFDF